MGITGAGASKLILELWIIGDVSGTNENEDWWIIGRQQIYEKRNGNIETGHGQSGEIVTKLFWGDDLRILENDFGKAGERRGAEAGNEDLGTKIWGKMGTCGKEPGELIG